MGRQLPVVDILGTAFCVDVQREELWQQNRPGNRISFNLFDLNGDGYTFLYDTETNSAPSDKTAITELGERYKWVTLPALMELDPEGIALKYHIPLEVLCPQRQIDPFDEDEDSYEDELYR